MKRIRGMKQLGKRCAITWDIHFKYTNWTVSISTVHNGHPWPIGLSVRFLWLGVSLVYVEE